MKPVILTFARYYLPGFRAGGPIRTIANLVERLGDAFEFRIVALDRDVGAQNPYAGIEGGAWIPQGKAFVQYVAPDRLGLKKVGELMQSTPHDLVYLNSFFDPRFTQQVLLACRLAGARARPIVIAPRGEFSPGALQIKAWKKTLFIRMAKWLRLYDGLIWQASSTRESGDIQRALLTGTSTAGRVVVSGHIAALADPLDAGHLPAAPDPGSPDKESAPLRVCFLSRISPMKHLDFALRALAQARVPVRFAIYGPVEDTDHWSECQALMAGMPANVEVVYEGSVEPEKVVSTLAQHDLFLLPTRGENFGHVIHEALRAGLTVLISDQTPWQRLEEQGAGWALPLSDPAAFTRRIEEVAGRPRSARQLSAARARNLALEVAQDADTIEATRRMFLDAIESREPTRQAARAQVNHSRRGG